MSNATLETLGNGAFRVNGDLDYESVTHLLAIDDQIFSQPLEKIVVDLAGIGRTTSVGLALMLEWLRQARRKHKQIEFSNIPAQMLAMAKISQLETILPIKESE